MIIFYQLTQQLKSLAQLLDKLKVEEYTKQIAHLGQESIGSHTRHIIELFQCALTGYETGTIDYVHRTRNLHLQQNLGYAQQILMEIIEMACMPDKTLNMVVESEEDGKEDTVFTSYYREIVYNTEHAIHHLALIKVALLEMNLYIVDEHFGMAYSTIKYKASLTNTY